MGLKESARAFVVGGALACVDGSTDKGGASQETDLPEETGKPCVDYADAQRVISRGDLMAQLMPILIREGKAPEGVTIGGCDPSVHGFADLDSTDPNCPAIQAAVLSGIAKGDSDPITREPIGTFRPGDSTTIAEAAVVVDRAYCVPADGLPSDRFTAMYTVPNWATVGVAAVDEQGGFRRACERFIQVASPISREASVLMRDAVSENWSFDEAQCPGIRVE